MSSATLTSTPTLRPVFKPILMKIIFLLILISLVVAAGFLLAYLWAARSGQFDDLDTPSIDILADGDHRPDTKPRADDD